MLGTVQAILDADDDAFCCVIWDGRNPGEMDALAWNLCLVRIVQHQQPWCLFVVETSLLTLLLQREPFQTLDYCSPRQMTVPVKGLVR